MHAYTKSDEVSLYIWQPDHFRGHVKIHSSVVFVIVIYIAHVHVGRATIRPAVHVGILHARKADTFSRNVARPTCAFAYLSSYIYSW